MSRTIALAAFAAVLAATAGSFVVLPSGKTRAADKDATFLIPAAEGYGVADCLTGGGSECGRIVADAYCEAQGFAKAESVRPRRGRGPHRRARRGGDPPRERAADPHHLRELSLPGGRSAGHLHARFVASR